MTNRFAWVLAVACVAATAATRPAADPVPPHLRDAQTLVANVKPADDLYVHKGCYIRWKGEAGATAYASHNDCSDFVALLFEHTYHFTPKQMADLTGKERPFANTWHDAIAAGRGGLRQVTHLADARPGDLLAAEFPPGAGDSGHVMMVEQLPVPHPASSPVVAGTRQWDVTIIDSTKSPHGPADTRKASAATGVGRGTIRIYTNPDGTVAGYAWSDSDKTAYRPMAERNLVIGRLERAAVASR